jgi:hydroxymethylglutaryl-CoA lyase
MEAAKADGIPVRGYVSVVTDCPYDGPTAPSSVAQVVAKLRDLGCAEVSLGETLGKAQPEQVTAMLRAVLQEMPADRLAGHFHDTAGRALRNIDASLELGLRIFDAACGGLGGCPYAPGAAGNVATEAVAAHLEARGFSTRLDMQVVAKAAILARAMRAGDSDV